MIHRLWRGWAAPAEAAAYEQLLLGQIAPAIMEWGIPGLQELSVLRRDPREREPGSGTEILTAMTFADLGAVAQFTGGDPSTSVVPPEARRLLARFDEHSRHYTTLATFPARR